MMLFLAHFIDECLKQAAESVIWQWGMPCYSSINCSNISNHEERFSLGKIK